MKKKEDILTPKPMDEDTKQRILIKALECYLDKMTKEEKSFYGTDYKSTIELLVEIKSLGDWKEKDEDGFDPEIEACP